MIIMEISVIIPVYNVERYIDRCIKSVLNQTFQNFEIVIVNDSSPDNSIDIVNKYAKSDNRFVVINNDKNMGLMWTRMVGYKNARGKYFVFCDSDDFLPNNALKSLYDGITSSKSSIVIGNTQCVSDEEERDIIQNKLSFGTEIESIYKSLLVGELPHSLWGKIYDHTLFENHQYETFKQQTNGEDGILFYQLVKNIESVKLIDDIVYYYYVNPDSSTKSKITDKKLQEILFTSDYISSFIKDNAHSVSNYLDRHETRTLLSIVNAGVSPKKIDNLSNIINRKELSSLKSLLLCYSPIRAFILYGIMNNYFIRSAFQHYIKQKNKI